jgi:hypothetical protein
MYIYVGINPSGNSRPKSIRKGKKFRSINHENSTEYLKSSYNISKFKNNVEKFDDIVSNEGFEVNRDDVVDYCR